MYTGQPQEGEHCEWCDMIWGSYVRDSVYTHSHLAVCCRLLSYAFELGERELREASLLRE